jgi:DNA helicase-2/ATP-dependent DNA helicase PcrA
MTNRAAQPDTEADQQLRQWLDADDLTSFIMVAGAGSGKTTSLVKALDHIRKTRGAKLRRRGQRIACITYTEIAAREISLDVGAEQLFHVSTIHSFLWTIIRPFQEDIRAWVTRRLHEKIGERTEKLGNPSMRPAPRARAEEDIARYRQQLAALPRVPGFAYRTGSDYSKGILGHSDVLKMVPELLKEKALFRTIMAQRFPFVFVDESQDTEPQFVEALRAVDRQQPKTFCVGFFGDPMQQIYFRWV